MLLTLSLVAGVLAWALLAEDKAAENAAPSFVELDWKPGTGVWAGGEQLAASGLVASPRLFAAYLLLAGGAGQVEPGSHWLRQGLSPRELLQCLDRASPRPAVKVTIPEGWDSFQIARRLESQGICSAARFLEVARAVETLRSLGIPAPSAEGYLFPATYELLLDSDPQTVVRLLVTETEERLAKIAERFPGALERLERELGWKLHEVLTLASIIEKEAAKAEERATIASVFFNRLSDPEFKPAQRLQSDPTAAYGCKAYPELQNCAAGGRVTPAMLRDDQNPYNTYRHPGLPPGPIASAGEGAIAAVLAPEHTSYLFFVATGNGSHRFSRTFEEHHRAVQVRSGAHEGAQ